MKDFNWCDFTGFKSIPGPGGHVKTSESKRIKDLCLDQQLCGTGVIHVQRGCRGRLLLKTSKWRCMAVGYVRPGLAIVDFTNPAACEWYSKKLEALLDMGVDCFKTDFGERIPTDAVYYDGSDPVKMHNYYTYLYNKVVFNVLKKKKGEKEAVLFARSATAGGRSSRFTGAVTAGLIMNPWRRAFAEACH